MSKETMKFHGPNGEFTLTHEEVKLLFNTASYYLDVYIDSEWDKVNDNHHTALTHKDPEIMESQGYSWIALSDATKVQKLIDEKYHKKPYHNNEHRFECDECGEVASDKELN